MVFSGDRLIDSHLSEVVLRFQNQLFEGTELKYILGLRVMWLLMQLNRWL